MPDETYVNATIALSLWDQAVAYANGEGFDQKRAACREFARLLDEALQKAFDAGRQHERSLTY